MRTKFFTSFDAALAFVKREGRWHCWAHEKLRIVELGSDRFKVARYDTRNRLVAFI